MHIDFYHTKRRSLDKERKRISVFEERFYEFHTSFEKEKRSQRSLMSCFTTHCGWFALTFVGHLKKAGFKKPLTNCAQENCAFKPLFVFAGKIVSSIIQIPYFIQYYLLLGQHLKHFKE